MVFGIQYSGMKKYRPITINRRAKFDYDLDDRLLCGIALIGAEVKSIRQGKADLKGSFASIKDGELWLNNVTIPPYQPAHAPENYDGLRARKLLVHKKELKKVTAAKQNGLQLVPLSIGKQGRFIKVELGLGASRKKHDKREAIKKRSDERESRRSIKSNR